MPELSEPYRKLAETCPTCGKPLPCPLHDDKLREAILHPPERERSLWAHIERTDIGEIAETIYSMDTFPDGRVAVGSSAGNIALLDPSRPDDDGQRLRVFYDVLTEEDPRAIWAIHALHGDQVLVGGNDHILSRIDLAKPAYSPGYREILGRYDNNIRSILALPNGSILVGGWGGVIKKFDTGSGSPARETNIGAGTGDTIRTLAPFSDGTILALLGDGRMLQLDPSHPEDARELYDAGEQALAARPLPDGSIIFGVRGGDIKRWDPAQQGDDRVQVLANYGEPIRAISVTSDHSFLVGGGGGKIARYAIPGHLLRAHRERKLQGPETPPMPE